MVFHVLTVTLMALCMLLVPKFPCTDSSCPPPDFPKSGGYTPAQPAFDTGGEIQYFCNRGLPMFYQNEGWFPIDKVVTCQSTGNWSEPTIFCDIPAKLNSWTASSEEDSREAIVADGTKLTCFDPIKDTKEILRFSLDGELIPFAAIICLGKGSAILNVVFSPYWSFTYDTDKALSPCVLFSTNSYQSKAENITVEVSPKPNSSISLCEIFVYAKEEKWCLDPPEFSVPNGQLVVSRSQAVLYCKDGFREKENKTVYATCENNKWSYESVQCMKAEPDKACEPPDFPQAGSYQPKKAEYQANEQINYTCHGKFAMFLEKNAIRQPMTVTCLENGKWSQVPPFCDNLTKIWLKDPPKSLKVKRKSSILEDGKTSTCFPIPKDEKLFLEYSLERETVVFSILVCFWHGKATITVNISETAQDIYDEEFGFDSVGCVISSFLNNEKETEYVTVQVSPEKNTSLLLCEVMVFSKKYKWCRHPPVNSVPNSHLEVGRSKAVLNCYEGFEAKDDERLYATCKNNTWSYQSLQCVEIIHEKDYRILGIILVFVSILVFLILVCIAIYVFRRRQAARMFAKFKSRKSNIQFSSASGEDHSTSRF